MNTEQEEALVTVTITPDGIAKEYLLKECSEATIAELLSKKLISIVYVPTEKGHDLGWEIMRKRGDAYHERAND